MACEKSSARTQVERDPVDSRNFVRVERNLGRCLGRLQEDCREGRGGALGGQPLGTRATCEGPGLPHHRARGP